MKIDARKISTEAQQEKRNTAIKLRKKNMTCQEVAEIVEVHHTTIARWYAKYKRDGNKAIKVGQRGRKTGANKSLSPEQEQQIIRQLID